MQIPPNSFPWNTFIACMGPILVVVANAFYQARRDKKIFQKEQFTLRFNKWCDAVERIYEAITPAHLACLESKDGIDFGKNLDRLISILQENVLNRAIFLGIQGFKILNCFTETLINIKSAITPDIKRFRAIIAANEVEKHDEFITAFNKKLEKCIDEILDAKAIVNLFFIAYFEKADTKGMKKPR